MFHLIRKVLKHVRMWCEMAGTRHLVNVWHFREKRVGLSGSVNFPEQSTQASIGKCAREAKPLCFNVKLVKLLQ
jgi:hypothetical protein